MSIIESTTNLFSLWPMGLAINIDSKEQTGLCLVALSQYSLVVAVVFIAIEATTTVAECLHSYSFLFTQVA